MTHTPRLLWKLLLFELVGISLCGIGLVFALAVISVSFSEERVVKEKQQLMAKMDEMKRALTAAKAPEEQIPGLLRIHKAALVSNASHKHFIIPSVLVLLSLLAASVGLTLVVWAKFRAFAQAEKIRVDAQIGS
jgi:hypothetical protein